MDQQPQYQPSQQPVTPEPGFNQPQRPRNTRLYFLIAIVVLLGAAAYGGIWWWGKQSSEVAVPTVTPRPDSTADWQTYRNEEYGFEFRYPEDHLVQIQAAPSDFFLLNIGSTTLKPIYETSDKADFVISVSKEKPDDFKDFQVIPEREIAVDNIKTVERLITYPAGYGKRYSAVVRKGEFYYEILSYEVDLFPLAKERFDQILSTFKFIPSTPLGTGEPEICIQVITPARNPQTGETRDFPTPCDVPEGWEKL